MSTDATQQGFRSTAHASGIINTDSTEPVHDLHHRHIHDEETVQLLPRGATAPIGSAFTPSQLSEVDKRGTSKAFYCLYASHALARWAWRTWEFSVALILMKLHPESLLLVSAYGLLDNLVRLILGSFIGQYIDRSDRLGGAVTCYAVQNLCIASSAAAAALLVWLREQQHESLTMNVDRALLWIAVVAGASSSIGSLGAAVAVEREYPKVLCGTDSAQLSKVNSAMRAIDLSSQMLAPVVSGFLMTYVSMTTAIAVQALYCVAVWLPECLLLYTAHKLAPALRQPKPHESSCTICQAKKHQNRLSALLGLSGWSIYFQQSTVLAGLALSLLYLTVLSLGFLMTSYLAWRGMSEATLSLFRAAGALSGLSATLMFNPIRRSTSLKTAGTIGITWQLCCLVLGVMPVVISHVTSWKSNSMMHQALLGLEGMPLQSQDLSWVHRAASSPPIWKLRRLRFQPGANITNAMHDASTLLQAGSSSSSKHVDSAGVVLYGLLCGLVASRMGLWLFDLAVSQLQQEQVSDNQLGTVSGVQASIQSFFEILSFIAGCIVYQPERFHWLMVGSCCAVAAAAAMYVAFVSRHTTSRLHGSGNG